MALPDARRLLTAGLLAACVAVFPFAGQDLGHTAGFLPAWMAAIVLCDLLAAGLLFAQFLSRGGSTLLGLACAYLFAGLLAVVHALVLPGVWTDGGLLGVDPQVPAWLWGVAHAGLPAGLAAALWGGPPELRRALAAPTIHRGRVAVACAAGVAAVVFAVTALLAGIVPSLPAAMDGDHLTDSGRVAAPLVIAFDLLALVTVARRGRREEIERRLAFAVSCLLAGTVLTAAAEQRYAVGWYAASVLELIAAAIVLVTLLTTAGRASNPGPADASAGASDALTGVLTRGATLVAAEHLHRSRAPGSPLAIALVDVDGLKAIGDRHGPLAADAVLLTVARRLKDCLREVDVLGRAGDEGFVVVLPDTDADGVTLAIDRAIASIRDEAVGTWAHDVRTTASGGIAMVGTGDDAVAEALAGADQALLQAKAHGRDQVVSPARAQVVQLRRREGAGSRQG